MMMMMMMMMSTPSMMRLKGDCMVHGSEGVTHVGVFI